MRRWAQRVQLSAVVGLASLALTAGVSAALPSAASAYYNAWNCYNYPSGNFCWDPTPNSEGGAWHNWQQAEIENLSDVQAGQELQITDGAGRKVTFFCDGTVGKNGTCYKSWGTRYDYLWPIAGAGAQNTINNGYRSTFWVWFEG